MGAGLVPVLGMERGVGVGLRGVIPVGEGINVAGGSPVPGEEVPGKEPCDDIGSGVVLEPPVQARMGVTTKHANANTPTLKPGLQNIPHQFPGTAQGL